jgi:integrase
MALTTGARKGELLKLRWSNIDFKNRLATLIDTKNGDDRIVPLPIPAIEELAKFRTIGNELVFKSEHKAQVTSSVEKSWYPALKLSNIENFKFHDLRHTAASYLAMNNADLLEIADILGHRCIQTTKRYAHLNTAHKQDLSDRVFGNILDN